MSESLLTPDLPPPTNPLKTENASSPVKESADDRSSIINRLKNISTAVSDARGEQNKEAEQNPFNQQAQKLIKLGNSYIDYLEAHSGEITDPKIFQAIASLAKTSLVMNIEQYAVTIKGIGDYVTQHPQLNDLNPPGKKDGPWSNIKEALYFTKNNDAREQYRERILTKAQLLIIGEEFSPRDVDHLERFLTDPQGRPPSEFIPGYIEEHAADLQQWLPLRLEEFQKFVADRSGDDKGKMADNPFLRQLDEEIASIKQKNLQDSKTLSKVQFPDRQKKLAFIRDIRFGRAAIPRVRK